ncbi:MAG: fructose-bisphosphatase class I [Flavobacteriales bacterium]|nr:fructose-bisphosphatase class I [Flavobacteriales bacterium]|tara:strand:+ start:9280 stop:10212 length:933 start_codon:yes stop_codon:yes gene_type:complete
MNLSNFLKNKNYNSELKNILLNIQSGSIEVYKKINEENNDVLGSSGQKNIQNEEVQKLDIIANDIFIDCFSKNSTIHSVLSEENEDTIDLSNSGKYLIAMDPLDGSSNIDVNIPVGSIFSILENNINHFLQAGKHQKLACYVIYGTSTVMVFAIENDVFSFTLNTKTKEYILSHDNIKTPEDGTIFSINEGNYNSIDNRIIEYVNICKNLNSSGKRTHTGRFVGSLVADFHRNMLKGGIFIYPKTSDKPHGQLRLIYECNPIAFIAKNANAKSTSLDQDILSIIPSKMHQRTPFVVGSNNMVNKLLSFFN